MLMIPKVYSHLSYAVVSYLSFFDSSSSQPGESFRKQNQASATRDTCDHHKSLKDKLLKDPLNKFLKFTERNAPATDNILGVFFRECTERCIYVHPPGRKPVIVYGLISRFAWVKIPLDGESSIVLA